MIYKEGDYTVKYAVSLLAFGYYLGNIYDVNCAEVAHGDDGPAIYHQGVKFGILREKCLILKKLIFNTKNC